MNGHAALVERSAGSACQIGIVEDRQLVRNRS